MKNKSMIVTAAAAASFATAMTMGSLPVYADDTAQTAQQQDRAAAQDGAARQA